MIGYLRQPGEFDVFHQYIQKHPEEADKLLDWEYSELDLNYPWYGPYGYAAKVIPNDYTILDLGCYMGLQALLFQNHAGYVGVECGPATPTLSPDLITGSKIYNAFHEADIADVIEHPEFYVEDDTDAVVALCFWVPGYRTWAQTEKLRQKFKYHMIFYPGEQPITSLPSRKSPFCNCGRWSPVEPDGPHLIHD